MLVIHAAVATITFTSSKMNLMYQGNDQTPKLVYNNLQYLQK